jgi:hypothetical protein
MYNNYRLTLVEKTNGERMYWLEKIVCRDSKQHDYFEITDALVLPRLNEGQALSHACKMGDNFFSSSIIAIGKLDDKSPIISANGVMATQFITVDSVWSIDPEIGKFVQVTPEKVVCVKFVGRGIPPSPTQVPTKTPKVIAGEFTLKKALELLYGDEGIVQTDNGEVIIRTKRVTQSGEEVTAIIRAVLAAPFRENGVDKYVVLVETEAEGMGSHSSRADVGGAILHTGKFWTFCLVIKLLENVVFAMV